MMDDPGRKNDGGQGEDGDLAETKRIMERLVRTPPKPHGKKPLTKGDDDKEDDGRPAKRDRRPD